MDRRLDPSKIGEKSKTHMSIIPVFLLLLLLLGGDSPPLFITSSTVSSSRLQIARHVEPLYATYRFLSVLRML